MVRGRGLCKEGVWKVSGSMARMAGPRPTTERCWKAFYGFCAAGLGGGIAPVTPGGTPAGTYTLTLTATAGTVTHNTTATLRVN